MTSTFRSSTLTGSLPTVWTASLWKMMPASRAIAPISAIGSIVPTSLFACMIEMNTVSGRMALRTSSGSTMPVESTATLVTSQPFFSSHSIGSRTA